MIPNRSARRFVAAVLCASVVLVACSAGGADDPVAAPAEAPIDVSAPASASATATLAELEMTDLPTAEATSSDAAIEFVPPSGASTATTTDGQLSSELPEPVVAVAEIYDGAMAAGFRDAGWAKDRVIGGGPATIDLGGNGGWLIAGTMPPSATALEFRLSMERDLGSVVQVALGHDDVENVGRSVLLANNRTGPDGWVDVRIPIVQLTPTLTPVNAIRVFPRRALASPARVKIDRMRFTRGGELRAYGSSIDLTAAAAIAKRRTTSQKTAPSVTKVAPTKGPATTRPQVASTAAPSRAAAAGLRPAPAVAGELSMAVDCRGEVKRISPLIYGVGWAGAFNQPTPPWDLNPAANRWGGNPTSRYNWRLGNVWNTANDWYFRNVTMSDAPNAIQTFLSRNEEHSVASAVTVPALGWVAKDATSYGYPVATFGEQASSDPDLPDAGNGFGRNGKRLAPGAPTQTSIESTPASVSEWVRTMLRGRTTMYFIDNEPELWDSTHADVHPKPVGYDELLDTTIRYATAVRSADPNAAIAGPSSWGWTAYNWSGIDAAAGFDKAPDRKAHENLPFLAWYLREVRRYEQRTGQKLLDLLDVHFYPMGKDVFSNGAEATSEATAALRLRQTRGLWDPTYSDESWIGEPVYLIPRLRSWISTNAPGLGISIGEWNFGGENHMSGGLATAEALGRFGVEGVTSAYYWTAPPPQSPAFWGFRAYRNFDGRGGRFGDISVKATVNGGNGVAEKTSLFASRDEKSSEVVLVALNLDPSRQRTATIQLGGCGTLDSSQAFRYRGGPAGFTPDPRYGAASDSIGLQLPPYSITVVRALMR